MDTLSLVFTTHTNACAGPTDAKSAGALRALSLGGQRRPSTAPRAAPGGCSHRTTVCDAAPLDAFCRALCRACGPAIGSGLFRREAAPAAPAAFVGVPQVPALPVLTRHPAGDGPLFPCHPPLSENASLPLSPTSFPPFLFALSLSRRRRTHSSQTQHHVRRCYRITHPSRVSTMGRQRWRRQRKRRAGGAELPTSACVRTAQAGATRRAAPPPQQRRSRVIAR
eukprot:356549-Chlamydomonas_euryale.AAC.1